LSASATKQKPKAKSKPNQSILSFFKKAPEKDEALFIEEARQDSCEIAVVPEAGEDEDLYRSTPPREQSREDGGEERFNEIGGSVKRRKLSPSSAPRSSSASPQGGQDATEKAGQRQASGPSESDAQNTSKPEAKSGASAASDSKKKKAGNPFLDDSSDDSEDDKENEPASVEATARVRPLQSGLGNDTSEQIKRPRPVELTNGERGSRVPLLRQQTSGAEAGGDRAEETRNDVGDSDDIDLFEGDDFTGEELRMMQFMEEQARLEAEEGGEEYDTTDDKGDAMAESCPVCNGSLAGVTPEEATAHVNSCLDGNPTPLPNPLATITGVATETEAAVMSKRFAKAAVARPGQANPISLGGIAGEGPSTSAFTKLMSGHAEDAAWATAAAAESASRGMPAYKRKCPFYKIMPGFSICVDAFRYGAVEGCQAYFLSHFHSDHYMGLTANWTHGPIYCSKVTGSLVKSQLRTAGKYVVELEFEETVPVPETKDVTVTMIPANHCPGSSLFLFEKTTSGKTQRILHCGDFRACPSHVEHPKLRPEMVDALSGRTKQQKIDVCYLDTTYLNPRYSFPPQHDVINACAELCSLLNKSLLANDNREWDALLRRRERSGTGSSNNESVTKFFTAASNTPPTPSSFPPSNAFAALNGRPHHPNRLLVVCGTYSIGKERICVAIAKALNTKIYATPAKIRMCKQLDDPELSSLLTSDPCEAQVHMQMIMEIRAETLAEYLEAYRARGEFGRIVGFRPSGWNYRPAGPGGVNGKGNGGGTAGAPAVAANLAPGSLPTTQLLHGPGWRTRFGVRDLVPQRGSGKEVLCFGVPYSEHSSFRELALFLMALRIERVVPTVNVGSEASRRRMKGWIDRWLGERRRGGLVRVLEGKEGEGDEGERGGLWDGKDGKGGGVYW
jgi:hypothetical protein